MTTENKTPGQVCYEARYAGFIGKGPSKTHVRPWSEIADSAKACWERAALAVMGLEIEGRVVRKS